MTQPYRFHDPQLARMAAAAKALRSEMSNVEPTPVVSATIVEAPPATPPGIPTVPVGYWTQEQVNAERERVRQEEKDKVYGRLSAAEEERNRLRAEAEERVAAATAEKERLAAAAKAAKEADMSAKELFESQRLEYEQRFADLQAERDRDRAFMAKEREFQQLATYTAQAIAANAANILPRFQDPSMIQGNSVEEINAAVERLVTLSTQTLEDLRGVQDEANRSAPGVSAYAPAVGPEAGLPTQRTYTQEQIAGQSMKEWAQTRKAFGLDRHDSGSRGILG